MSATSLRGVLTRVEILKCCVFDSVDVFCLLVGESSDFGVTTDHEASDAAAAWEDLAESKAPLSEPVSED